MDKDIAEFVARIAFKNSSELTRLIPILKDHLEEDEYQELFQSIVKISTLIGKEVLFKIFDKYPEIDKDFKHAIDKFGKLP